MAAARLGCGRQNFGNGENPPPDPESLKLAANDHRSFRRTTSISARAQGLSAGGCQRSVSTTGSILAVVAPDTARLVRAYVALDENADTAATDGVRIWLPPTFEGVDVAHDTPVAVGLLVHELGHFLQPLAGTGGAAAGDPAAAHASAPPCKLYGAGSHRQPRQTRSLNRPLQLRHRPRSCAAPSAVRP